MRVKVRWCAKCCGAGGRESRICETAVAGYVRPMFALCPRCGRSRPHCNDGLEGAQSKSVFRILLESNC